MKKNLFYIFLIIAFILGICIRIYISRKEENALFSEYLKNYIPEFKKISISEKNFFVVKLESDTPLVYSFKDKNFLILYFRISDCITCLEELKCIVDSLKDLKFLKVLVVTDHPVLYEIKYFMYKLEISEVIWDRGSSLFNSHIKKTPLYIFIKKNKIKEIGIIAPVKVDGKEVYGLLAHKLKRRLK